jgi:glucosylceramidase
LPKYDNLKKIKVSFTFKKLLFSEGCTKGFNSEKLQLWPNAEWYGNAMISDFNSSVVGLIA